MPCQHLNLKNKNKFLLINFKEIRKRLKKKISASNLIPNVSTQHQGQDQQQQKLQNQSQYPESHP